MQRAPNEETLEIKLAKIKIDKSFVKDFNKICSHFWGQIAFPRTTVSRLVVVRYSRGHTPGHAMVNDKIHSVSPVVSRLHDLLVRIHIPFDFTSSVSPENRGWRVRRDSYHWLLRLLNNSTVVGPRDG